MLACDVPLCFSKKIWFRILNFRIPSLSLGLIHTFSAYECAGLCIRYGSTKKTNFVSGLLMQLLFQYPIRGEISVAQYKWMKKLEINTNDNMKKLN